MTRPSEISEPVKVADAATSARSVREGGKNSRRRITLAWVAVSCWAFIVWRLGGDAYSAVDTNSIIVEWLRTIFADLDAKRRVHILLGIRKAAHFIEYAILAALTFRAASISAARIWLIASPTEASSVTLTTTGSIIPPAESSE